MARLARARRYAQAVFAMAQESGQLDQWRQDLDDLAQALSGLRPLLESPRLPLAEKMRLVREALPQANPLALNLANLLTARGRLDVAPELSQEYGRLVDAQRGIEHVEVAAAVPLADGERSRIAEVLSSFTGRRVVVTDRIEPELLGGLVLRMGDHVIDGSVRSQLEALKKNLVEGGW